MWLSLQLGVFSLVVWRVPLAARYPEPAESLAAHLVFGTQVVAAAALFPFLLRDARTAVQIIVTALPFQLAAGYLAGVSPEVLVWPAAMVTAWLATLASCAPLLRTARAKGTGVTFAVLLTIGLAAIRYLRVEFGARLGESRSQLEHVSPLLSTFRVLEGTTAHWAWLALAVLLAGATTTLVSRRLRRKRHFPAELTS